MQNIEQADYQYIIQETYVELIVDFLKLCIPSIASEYYESRDDEEWQAELIQSIIKIVEMIDSLNSGVNIISGIDDIKLLWNELDFNVFEIIRRDKDIDNTGWLYSLMMVWKDLDEIMSEYFQAKRRLNK